MTATALPAAALDARLDAGLQVHELRESDASGTLVREQGAAPRLALSLVQGLSDAWTLTGTLDGWASRARYDGQSQSGVPIDSHTDTQALTLDGLLQWRPVASSGAHLDAGWQVEQFRRRINGSGIYSGLDERLTQPRWRLGGGWSGAGVEVRASVLWGDRAPLSVGFDQGLYDRASLRSGRAAGLALDASWTLAREWRLGASLEALSVGRSLDAPLARGGNVVGIVAQPRWRRERVALTLQYSFADGR